MAGTGRARGGLGWVILVVALAVPGVLFYNWWSHLKADREKTVAAKARGRVPDGGVFQSSPNTKLVNPMTPAVSTAAAPPPLTSVPAVSAMPAAPQDASAATLTTPPLATAPAAGADQPPAISSMTVPALPLKRDPTLSPFDPDRLVEIDEAKRKAAEDLENMKRPKMQKKAKAVNPTTLLNLQGIVSNPESGYKAIVNDEVLSAGEYVGSTKIKIVKINDLGVTFEYQGKRFSKSVSRD